MAESALFAAKWALGYQDTAKMTLLPQQKRFINIPSANQNCCCDYFSCYNNTEVTIIVVAVTILSQQFWFAEAI